jgi:hypothetical protein
MKNEKQKYDYNKLQNEFSLYKIKNNGKSLKDFCIEKKLNYNTIRKNIKVTKAKEALEVYTTTKEKAFTDTIKKKLTSTGFVKAIIFVMK